MFTVLGNPGEGSTIVEAALELSGLPYKVEHVNQWEEGPTRERLREVNPLLQVPTLLLPDGTVMTESAAIVLLTADLAPEARLVPPAGDPDRARFLRWLIFLVAAVYPTFTYGDEPSRYVKSEAAKKELRDRTDEQRKELHRMLEGAASGAPWFLGSALSAIDLYIWVMVRWRPRRAWFEETCPKLAGIATALDKEPRLRAVRERNFPNETAA
jgi:GST-like protein